MLFSASFRRSSSAVMSSWSSRWPHRARNTAMARNARTTTFATSTTANVGRRAYQKKHFQDLIKMQVRGGNGGLGCNSYDVLTPAKRRPDGGSGGRGGSVIIECCESLSGGLSVRKRSFSARNGTNGTSQRCNGGKGADTVVKVPRGTVVHR